MQHITHGARLSDPRRITLCGESIDRVHLVPWGEWPSCPACTAAVKSTPNHQRALGLADAPANVSP